MSGGLDKQDARSQPSTAQDIKVTGRDVTSGFFVSYAAAAVVSPIMLIILGLAITDHNAIDKLDAKLEYLNSRLIDGSIITRLVDHDATASDRFRSIEDRMKSLETFAGASTQDRAALHFELNSLREWLRYQGKNLPEPPNVGSAGGQHP